MVPERRGQEMVYSVSEAAEVLGISRQAVYQAINSGQLTAQQGMHGRQVGVQELLGYGIRRGKDPNTLVHRIQENTGADVKDLLLWLLAGLGLVLLVKTLLGQE